MRVLMPFNKPQKCESYISELCMRCSISQQKSQAGGKPTHNSPPLQTQVFLKMTPTDV
jgi:hypothetical protein